MKAADARVIEVLNDVLTAELTAINQYFVHAEMCENWGYRRLQKVIRHHSIGEMKHAEEVIERQPPDGVRVEQHQPGQDPEDPEERRVGRREPEGIPPLGERACEGGRVAGNQAQGSSHRKTFIGCSS